MARPSNSWTVCCANTTAGRRPPTTWVRSAVTLPARGHHRVAFERVKQFGKGHALARFRSVRHHWWASSRVVGRALASRGPYRPPCDRLEAGCKSLLYYSVLSLYYPFGRSSKTIHYNTKPRAWYNISCLRGEQCVNDLHSTTSAGFNALFAFLPLRFVFSLVTQHHRHNLLPLVEPTSLFQNQTWGIL